MRFWFTSAISVALGKAQTSFALHSLARTVYETFSEDAVSASDILGITLTRRANGANNYVELAGFPHHALDTYLPKLVRAGKRVAICEQIESPLIQKKMKSKTAVTEVVTPAKAEPVNKVPVTKAVDEVKKAVAPI